MPDPRPLYVQFWMAEAALPGKRVGVVEVLREADAETPHLVLVSELVDGRLQCRVAFASASKHCDELTAKGFICIEALIRVDEDRLSVRAAAFVHGQREIDYSHEWLAVTGVTFDAKGKAGNLQRDYEQVLATPDLVLPAESVRNVAVVWPLDRQSVVRSKREATITLAELRWPKTLAVKGERAAAVWTGTIARRAGAEIWADPVKSEPRRERRPAEFGSYRSNFRAVEVLGVRLDVPRLDARRQFKTDVDRQGRQEEELYGLIAPLNFHLPRGGEGHTPDRTRPDFYYRPATSALTIELLRYGRMSVAETIGGMEPEDVQSQHELLVRIVVGRVDEDAGQAQDVATFVPALFVDNTWSKYLGRQYMGLDKRLAYFCTRGDDGEIVPLSPQDAYDRRDTPAEALSRIAEVRLAPGLCPPAPLKPPEDADPEVKAAFDRAVQARQAVLRDCPVLLSIDCDSDMIEGWADFQPVPTDAVLRNSPLAGRRWRQEDFDDAEVRRDFARVAGQGSAGSFLGTQCSPLEADASFEERWATQTWVSGRYSMAGSATMARPKGVVRVTMHRVEGNPVLAWQLLCNLFEVPKRESGGTKTFVLGPGSWYRLLYDMDLSMQNDAG